MDVEEHLRRVGFGVVLVMVVAYLAVSLWRQRRRGRHRSGPNLIAESRSLVLPPLTPEVALDRIPELRGEIERLRAVLWARGYAAGERYPEYMMGSVNR